MSFGVTIDGFTTKRLSDILSEIEQQQRDKFGDIDVSPESGFGQLNGTFGNQLEEAWEQLENVYHSSSPNTGGLALDYVVAQNGLERLGSLSTVVNVGLNGTLNTIVPEGTQVRNTVTNELFNLTTDTTITDQNQLQLFVRVETVADATTYTITIDSTPYSIVSGGGSTAESIAQQLVDEILLDSSRIIEPTKIDGVIQLDANSTSFNTALTSNLIYFTPSVFESDNTGEILAVQDTLTTIETPVSGLDEVNNFIDGIKGRDPESDGELRVRREESLQILGGGTLEAIVARILNDVAGVTIVKGFENRSDVVDGDGRPPHSIEIVVVGGTDQDIADKLWIVKGGGINTFGNTSEDVTDSNGDLQTMFFTRPVSIDIWVKATLTLYSEETFPTDGEDQVKAKMLEYGNSLGIGEDVIGQRFHGPIYEVPGIGNIVVEISKVLPPPYTGGAQIVIDSDEVSSFILSRIDVDIP